MKNKLISFVENKYLNKNIPFLRSGYIVEVKSLIIDGTKKKIQIFKGIIISFKNRGLNSSFIVRKVSYNEGVEKIFLVHSPMINSIVIKKKKYFKKSKLYFLRNKSKFYVK